jgi:hypothetical protein
MHRRDVGKALLASAAGSPLGAQSAPTKNACDPPCYPATGREVAASIEPVVSYQPGNVMRYGASSSASKASNKAALQTAISLAATEGFTVTVPANIDYGYQVSDLRTYPDFKGIQATVIVMDYGPGSSYAGYPTAYDGSQLRVFFHTPQTPTPGNHDGNGFRIHGAWHPYFSINNTASLAAPGDRSRTAPDNRRASLVFLNDGRATYRLGQGTLAGKNYTNDQLSNFVLEMWGSPAAPKGGITVFLVDRLTGHVYFNTDSNGSDAAYHFKTRTAGSHAHLIESLGTTCVSVLRNSIGPGSDVQIKNASGDYVVSLPSVGDALTVSKSDGHVTVPGYLVLGKHYLWVDSAGRLRVKNGVPASDADGTVVGTQS